VTAVLDVFERLHRALPSRLLMVGDGPDLVEAAEKARAAGLSDAVRFLGDQDQVVQLLSASDLFLMPSAQESFGLAALEAMACEVPVVASCVGGVPELVEDGVTGVLCPAEDIDAMVAASIRLLTDEKLHERMAQAARKRALDRFTDKKIVPMYEQFYDEVLR
jgi:N-acetyl-alpha-D-glucosaminyl L-malate synthase BshA